MSNTNERDAVTSGNSLLDTVRSSCSSGNGNRPRELDLKGINWAGENLTNLDLSGYDFSGADLSGSDLSGSNLTWCRFAGADLHKAKLVDCEFLSSDLSTANLNEVTANRAGLAAADLSGASLVGADLRDATLSEAKLVRADLRAANLSGSSIRGANLEHAVFTRAELENVDLKYSNVRHTDFHISNLNNARLLGLKNYEKAVWIGADTRGVDHRGAFLILRHIRDENYIFEFRNRSRYHSVLYWIWWLTSDCGRSLLRWALSIMVLSLVFAGLYGLVEIDYGPYKTPFSAIYYSIVTLTTLGYGDVVPISLGAQIVVIAEALLGYVGLGGLLSILANKMARRAD